MQEFLGKVFINSLIPNDCEGQEFEDISASINGGDIKKWANGYFWNKTCFDSERPSQLASLQNKTTDLLLTGDVSLYNREELSNILGLCGDRLLRENDACIILKCYEKWGVDCIQHFVGDFAFGIIDFKNNLFFAARDHIGIKQLFYDIDGKKIIFGGRINEVLSELPSEQDINVGFITDYLLGLYPDTSETIFQRVRQIPPGHYLFADGQSLIEKKYWMPRVKGRLGSCRFKLQKDKFQDILRKATLERLDSSVLNGILLSGGLDSTSLFFLANEFCRANKKDFHIFSKVPNSDSCEEKSYIGEEEFLRNVLECAKVDAKICTKEESPSIQVLEQYFIETSSFPYNPFFQMVSPLLTLAENSGVENLISGYGGDETASCYAFNNYAYCFVTGRWRALYGMIKNYDSQEINLVSLVKNKIIFPLLPRGIQRWYRKRKFPNEFSVFNNGFIKKSILSQERLRNHYRKKHGVRKQSGILDPRKEILHSVTSGSLIELLALSRGLGRMYCQNHVFPFLDIRVVESCLSANPEDFSRDGFPRSFLRDSMKDLIPITIQKRKCKMNIGKSPDALLALAPDFVEGVIDKESKLAWSIIDRQELLLTYEHLIGDADSIKNKDAIAFQIGKCVNVAAFLQWLGK